MLCDTLRLFGNIHVFSCPFFCWNHAFADEVASRQASKVNCMFGAVAGMLLMSWHCLNHCLKFVFMVLCSATLHSHESPLIDQPYPGRGATGQEDTRVRFLTPQNPPNPKKIKDTQK
eukprot:6484573-Amphidinium_carterae.1